MTELQTTPVATNTRAIADTEKLEQLYNLREREEVLQFIDSLSVSRSTLAGSSRQDSPLLSRYAPYPSSGYQLSAFS